MLSRDPSLELGPPELPHGSVWLVGARDGNQRHLLPLAVHARGMADAVIHDPGISNAILDLMKPPRYREAAASHWAIERSIKRRKMAGASYISSKAIRWNARLRARSTVPSAIFPSTLCPMPASLLVVRRRSGSFWCANWSRLGARILAQPSSWWWPPSRELVRGVEQRQPPPGFSDVEPRRLATLVGRHSNAPVIGGHCQCHSQVLMI
jgi:hypothetical protein